jgi:hypothetical protein
MVTSSRKCEIGRLINRRQSTSRQESTRLQVSLKTVKNYVYSIRNGIPIYEAAGRPSLLDDDHFNQLVQYVGELPTENVSGNKLLILKYRELSKATVIRRLREVNEDIDEAKVHIPYSCRTRRRYCLKAVAAFNESQINSNRNCTIH